MPKLTTIIISYNTRQLLRACLGSLQIGLAQSGLQAEIWVVDNGSSDGSVAMVCEQFPHVRLIASDQNLGFAAGNNLPLKALLQNTEHAACAPRFVLLLNPDTTVQPGALGTLVAFMETHRNAAMAGVQLRYPDGSFQHSAFHFPNLVQIFLDFFPLHHRLIHSRLNGRYPRARYERGEPFEIDHPLGAAMIARWEAIQGVGLLDERFFMYCEEIDWCWRMRRAGWTIHCVPRAVVTHHEAQSTHQVRDKMFVQLWRSRFHLFHKHYSPLFSWTARQLVWLGVGAEMKRAQRAHLRGQLRSEAYQKRMEALRQVRQLR